MSQSQRTSRFSECTDQSFVRQDSIEYQPSKKLCGYCDHDHCFEDPSFLGDGEIFELDYRSML